MRSPKSHGEEGTRREMRPLLLQKGSFSDYGIVLWASRLCTSGKALSMLKGLVVNIVLQGSSDESTPSKMLHTTTVALQLTSEQWSIVLAGISDLTRPAESLSFTQNIALTATGVIWTRWCFVIKPRNILYEQTPVLEILF